MSTGLIATIIFALTYIGIVFTKLPRLNIDRPTAAFVGAVAMLCFGVVNLQEAVSFIDFNTIFLLLGMMLMISVLKADGFFDAAASKILLFATSRFKLLVYTVFITGIASAFLVNDAVVLIFTPIIISVCIGSGLNPLPYLMAEILASNAGSLMTMTGNPQNMLIGINSGMTYAEFMLHLLPIAMLGMLIIVAVIRLVYRKEFSDKTPLTHKTSQTPLKKPKLTSAIIFLLLTIAFFFGKILDLPLCVLAMVASSLAILFSDHKPAELMKGVDWVLLLFFASLFIVVGAVGHTGVLDFMFKLPLQDDLAGILSIHGISIVMSQILSNVPYTVLMLPLMHTADSQTLWLALASASTLAGNATILGAMANIIVIESADKLGVKISFCEFFKSGILVTLATYAISLLFLSL